MKLVDDTIALEILPRNSISLLNYVDNDIYTYCVDRRMK